MVSLEALLHVSTLLYSNPLGDDGEVTLSVCGNNYLVSAHYGYEHVHVLYDKEERQIVAVERVVEREIFHGSGKLSMTKNGTPYRCLETHTSRGVTKVLFPLFDSHRFYARYTIAFDGETLEGESEKSFRINGSNRRVVAPLSGDILEEYNKYVDFFNQVFAFASTACDLPYQKVEPLRLER